ncbi:hypothetical protein PBCVNEJV1_726L [Paramecium bursaria Chlorella virus NE-JV-1]|nr:hypothetical protein PBCVNEJV1_726L [Paramecium bursaria Chlorella virus NE-JV-1]
MELSGGTSLYAYKIDENLFEKVSLSWWMSSGKFCKSAMNRWTHKMTKLKSQILRASIDNSMIFLPVGQTPSRSTEDMKGHLILLCCETVIYAVGIVAQGPCICPEEYQTTNMKRLIAVHVLSTSFAKEFSWKELENAEKNDSLPEHLYKLSIDIADSVDVEMPKTCEYAYEREVVFAHRLVSLVEDMMTLETPNKLLEEQRQLRLRRLLEHITEKKSIYIPPPRPFVFSKMMKTHAKYASLYGRLQ